MKLSKNSEIIGKLDSFQIDDNETKLIFTIKREISIPLDQISSQDLKLLKGKRIGIINLDGLYRVREIGDRGGS
jgi:hypothetical protein